MSKLGFVPLSVIIDGYYNRTEDVGNKMSKYIYGSPSDNINEIITGWDKSVIADYANPYVDTINTKVKDNTKLISDYTDQLVQKQKAEQEERERLKREQEEERRNKASLRQAVLNSGNSINNMSYNEKYALTLKYAPYEKNPPIYSYIVDITTRTLLIETDNDI